MSNSPVESQRWAIKRAAARATLDPTQPGRRLSPPQKGVLMQLADMADDSGCCWPGVARLSERTAFSERCVRNALRSLEAMGLVRTSRGGGRGKSNEYLLQMGVLQLAAAQTPKREKAARPAASAPGSSAGNPAPEDTKPGTACPRITNTPHTNTPPTPSRGLDPLRMGERGREDEAFGSAKALLSLKDWLEQCREQGEQAIAPDDPVWTYAEQAGLPAEFVALAWRQFKRRRLGAGKRQRDWGRAFRDSVETCAYRLWRATGEGYTLTTEGQQAQRFFEQIDAAERVQA